jgi:hypothetical protein
MAPARKTAAAAAALTVAAELWKPLIIGATGDWNKPEQNKKLNNVDV